jgi:hypothetical protein
MKHKATATMLVQMESVFEDDGEHPLVDQAQAALDAEAEWRCCLREGEYTLEGLKTVPLGRG